MTKWTAALRKVRSEGRCRNCGSRDRLEAAHTIPRSLGGKLGADSVIPLCRYCHSEQHAHRLEMLPLMKPEEHAEAARVVGIARAYSYLTRGGS